MSFQFTHDGTLFEVHTEVGEGPTRVVVREHEQPAPDMEPGDEDAS